MREISFDAPAQPGTKPNPCETNAAETAVDDDGDVDVFAAGSGGRLKTSHNSVSAAAYSPIEISISASVSRVCQSPGLCCKAVLTAAASSAPAPRDCIFNNTSRHR